MRRAHGKVAVGALVAGVLAGCNHASKPTAPGFGDQADPLRGADAGSEFGAPADAGSGGSALVRFRRDDGCARDFKSSGVAAQDIAALERLCAQGMAPLFAEPASASATPAGVVEVPFKVASAACLRAAVVGAAGALSIALVDPRGAALASASSTEPLGVVPVDGTVCVREAGAYRAVVRLSGASAETGSVAVQIWQASRD